MAMVNPQLRPLEINPKTGEPFLRLATHANIILTPPRMKDAPEIMPILNDERVHQWLSGPPFPFSPEDAQAWLERVKSRTDAVLAELEAAREEPELKIVDDCPVGVLREVLEDGTDVFIGHITFNLARRRWELEGTGKESQERVLRDPKNPDVWMFSDYSAASHHGRGIMTDAVHTILHQWGIPRMGIRRMVVGTLPGNQGSFRVFEKNGFKFRKTYEDMMEVKGRMRSVHILDWSLEEEESKLK